MSQEANTGLPSNAEKLLEEFSSAVRPKPEPPSKKGAVSVPATPKTNEEVIAAFNAAVFAAMSRQPGRTRHEAIVIVARTNQELHRAYLKATNLASAHSAIDSKFTDADGKVRARS